MAETVRRINRGSEFCERAKITVLLLALSAIGAPHEVQGQSAQQPPAPTEAGLLAKGAKKLTPKDYETLYVGNTLTGTTSDGDPFHVFVESATAYRMEFQGKRIADKWHVGKDGEFCSAVGAEITCTREYTQEQAIHSFNPDGSYAGTARIRQGNPEKLQ